MQYQVSTIIPVFNGESFIVSAVESALNQETERHEIIVIDDGSTDKTPDLLRGFRGRIKVISQKNAGLSRARNRGILNATGEYIAFLDADDLWLPFKLRLQLELAEQGYGLVHSDTIVRDSETGRESPFSYRRKQDLTDYCFPQLFLGNAICVSSVIVRREVVMQNGGFDEAIIRPTTQDYDLWLRLASQKLRFGFVDTPSVVYRLHGSNASRYRLSMLEDEIYALEKAWDTNRSDLIETLGEQISTTRIAEALVLLAYNQRKTGNFLGAKRAVARAAEYGYRTNRIRFLRFIPDLFLRTMEILYKGYTKQTSTTKNLGCITVPRR
jgi:glycosyltransferase involved in cell wall biosynthesis